MNRGLSSRRSGFTLVELLTVIGIIALLIGILVPSLARARDVAKKTATAKELSAIEQNLEVFQVDYKGYPESNSYRNDPIVSGLPGAANGANIRLQGAHWLVRALAGPDTQGLDSQGLLLRDKSQVGTDGTGKLASVTGGAGVDFAAVRVSDRHGSYVEDNKIIARDTDAKFSAAPSSGPGSGPNTGRFVFIDTFNWPILYYRANPRAPEPFSARSDNQGKDRKGIYELSDNERITGNAIDGIEHWDFSGSGFKHGLGFFGPGQNTFATNPDLVEDTPLPSGQNFKGKSFSDYLHEHRAHDAGKVIKPVKPEGFVLISPGKDGIYGTTDDVNNFNRD